MDPATLATIAVAALAPLGVEAAKEVAKTAGKDVYTKLKTFLEGRFKGKPEAQQALANYEQKPELHKEAFTEVLENGVRRTLWYDIITFFCVLWPNEGLYSLANYDPYIIETNFIFINQYLIIKTMF